MSGRREHRWRGPTVATASAPIRADADYRLGVRPVIRSDTGNWVRQVGWGSMGYLEQRLGLDPAQVSWFAQFGALIRSTREMFSAQEGDWLYLDDFASPLLWPMLAHAARLGITLVTGKKHTEVHIGERAEITLDAAAVPSASAASAPTFDVNTAAAAAAAATAAEGATGTTAAGPAAAAASTATTEALATDSADARALRLTARLTIDETTAPIAGARVIGDHGVYVAALESRASFLLAPTAQPLTEEHRRLLSRPALVIPADEVEEFARDYYPRLARAVRVTGGDDMLPELHPPELVLTATFERAKKLHLEWAWLLDGVRHPIDARHPIQGKADATGRAPAPGGAPGDAAVEDAIIRRAESIFGRPIGALKLSGIDAAEFSTELLPQLQGLDGVRVEIVGERPDYRELIEDPHLTITATETDKHDWFDLGVIVTVEGRSVPFTPLFRALVKGRKKLLLVDNSYLSLQHPAFDELKRLIEEAGELAEWETGPRISRFQAELWSEFEDLADETVAAQSWRNAVRGLLAATAITAPEARAPDRSSPAPTPMPRIPVPPEVQATLRPYQRDGLDWLALLYEHRLGGILADDMGLGKTLQTLALIAHAQTRADTQNQDQDSTPPLGPFLVVAPTSVVSNWVSEAARYTPDLVVRSVDATEGTARRNAKGRQIREMADGAHIVITSYALFRLDVDAYQGIEWAGLILDEAQFVKNPASQAHRCALELEVPVKIALTGTPLENSLIDLWALFAVVAPGLFPSKRRFTEEYVMPISRRGGDETARQHAAERTAKLRRRIRPLMLRRTKELVASELPAKQEQVLHVDLTPSHRALHDTFLQRERQKLLGLVADLDRNRFIVLRSLTLLRMLSLDASLIDPEYADIPSAKLDALLEQLDDVAAEGHRALVFSQFTSFLKLAAARLDRAGIAYAYLDGSTLGRASVIDGFREGDAPVFLISLKAGGFGLNLTEADYVFLLDPWWNPASESQAIDRTHRIGQTRPVNVYRLVAAGTIEEKVMALRDRKAALFDAVMEDDAVFSSTLTSDDIRGLLEE